MHNKRKLFSNAKIKTELKKERKNRVRESTQVQRSTGQPRPFRKKEKPWERGPGPQVPQGGGWRGTQQSFSEVQPLILLYTIYDRLRYFFRLPSIDNCILFTYLV